MDVHEAKTFSSGGSVALRLPRSLAIDPGETIRIETDGDRLTLTRLPDRRRAARKLRALLGVLEAIGGPRGPAARFPDRPL
jgi:virulence-associated protein VagC